MVQTLHSLLFLLPKKIKNYEKIDKILKTNENRMITTYDVYQTLSSIIHKQKNSKIGQSLFEIEKSFNVTNCSSMKIKEEHCRFK